MVTEYGMSPALGPVRLAADPQTVYLGQSAGLDARVSPHTASQVDNETRRIVEKAVSRAWDLLDSNKDALEAIARRLREQETIESGELAEILEDISSSFTQAGTPLGLAAKVSLRRG
jgi:cell division protease FtsH